MDIKVLGLSLLSGIPCALIIDFLFGDITPLFYVLLVCIVLDIISGISKAVYTKKLASRILFKGGIRKGMLMFVIILANMIDITLFGGTPLTKTATLLYFIAMEGVSFIENLDAMDVPIPAFIKSALIQIQSKSEEQFKDITNDSDFNNIKSNKDVKIHNDADKDDL